MKNMYKHHLYVKNKKILLKFSKNLYVTKVYRNENRRFYKPIMDSSCFFVFIPLLVELSIAGDVRFVDAVIEFLSFAKDIS